MPKELFELWAVEQIQAGNQPTALLSQTLVALYSFIKNFAQKHRLKVATLAQSHYF